jgi:SNF family Na+-dependent transporter
MNGYQVLCLFFVWLLIFGCVFKGVKSASWVVWVTVPLPCLCIIILLIRGATLEGASTGIDWYLNGAPKIASF